MAGQISLIPESRHCSALTGLPCAPGVFSLLGGGGAVRMPSLLRGLCGPDAGGAGSRGSRRRQGQHSSAGRVLGAALCCWASCQGETSYVLFCRLLFFCKLVPIKSHTFPSTVITAAFQIQLFSFLLPKRN